MTIHESSCRKSGSGYGPAPCCAAAAWPAAVVTRGLALRLTTSSPELLRKLLRDVVVFQLSSTCSTCFGTFVKAVSSLLFRPDGLIFAPLMRPPPSNPSE